MCRRQELGDLHSCRRTVKSITHRDILLLISLLKNWYRFYRNVLRCPTSVWPIFMYRRRIVSTLLIAVDFYMYLRVYITRTIGMVGL